MAVSKQIDLNKLIRDNYESVKNGTYDWSSNDEAVKVLYRFAGKIVSNLNTTNLNRDDLIQEMVTRVFSHVLKNIDYDKCSNFSTYIYGCMQYNAYTFIKNMRNNDKELSLDAQIDKDMDFDFLSMFSDENPTPWDRLLEESNNEFYSVLKEAIKEDEVLKYYYIDGLNKKEIVSLYNNQYIRMKIKNQKEILKMKMYENGTLDLYNVINIENLLKGDKKQGMKIYNVLKDKGLLYLLYNTGVSVEDVCESFDVQKNTIRVLVNEKVSNIIKSLEDKGVAKSKLFVRFIIRAKPELLYEVDQMDERIINETIEKIVKDKKLYDWLSQGRTNAINEKRITNRNRNWERTTNILKGLKK